MGRFVGWFAVFVLCCAAALPAQVQPPASLEEALQRSFLKADVVFAGEVVAVDRSDAVVVVRFRLDTAVRGVGGDSYTLREWAGLWADDAQRYVIGKRYLMLLHAPSALGFASPVDRDGAVPLQGDGATETVDLRWLAAQVAVTDAARLAPAQALRAAGGSVEKANALLRNAAVMSPASPVSVVAQDDGNAAVDGAVVMGMLQRWQRVQAVAK